MVSWQPGIFLPFLLEMKECSLSFVLLSKKEFYSSLSKIIILLSCNSIDYVHCRTVIHTNIFFSRHYYYYYNFPNNETNRISIINKYKLNG
jgi:hypothetical protein